MRPVASMVLVAVAALGGCADSAPTAPTPPARQVATLAPGGSTAIIGTAYILRFDRVVSDSRCPGDAVCIQAGDAVVRATWLSAASAQTFELHTARPDPFVRDGLTVTLERLDPYPFSSLGAIAPDDYRATFVITR